VSRSILGMSTFREPCSPFHQDEEQLDTVPPGSSFFFYITLLVGMVEGKKKIVDGERGERWEKSVSLQ